MPPVSRSTPPRSCRPRSILGRPAVVSPSPPLSAPSLRRLRPALRFRRRVFATSGSIVAAALPAVDSVTLSLAPSPSGGVVYCLLTYRLRIPVVRGAPASGDKASLSATLPLLAQSSEDEWVALAAGIGRDFYFCLRGCASRGKPPGVTAARDRAAGRVPPPFARLSPVQLHVSPRAPCYPQCRKPCCHSSHASLNECDAPPPECPFSLLMYSTRLADAASGAAARTRAAN